MVRRSIRPKRHITEAQSRAQVRKYERWGHINYRGYGLTYRTTYNILYGECTIGEPFWVRRPKSFRNDTILHSSLYSISSNFRG